MATLASVTATPNPAPSGQTSRIQVTFTVAPATSDLTANIQVFENGVARGSATGVVLQGSPAETTPTVSVGATGTGWEIRTSAGTLVSAGGNAFTLSR